MRGKRINITVSHDVYSRLERISRQSGRTGVGRTAADILRLAANAGNNAGECLGGGGSDFLSDIFQEMAEWEMDHETFRKSINERL